MNEILIIFGCWNFAELKSEYIWSLFVLFTYADYLSFELFVSSFLQKQGFHVQAEETRLTTSSAVSILTSMLLLLLWEVLKDYAYEQ